MAYFSFLGKRGPETQPLGARTNSGTPPSATDVPAPPPAKAADTGERELSMADIMRKLNAMDTDNKLEFKKLSLTVKENEEGLGQVKEALKTVQDQQVSLAARLLAVEKGKAPQAAATDPEVQQQQESLSETVETLKQQLERQDQQQRSLNVMLYGMTETAQPILQQVQESLRSAGVPAVAVSSAKRLGLPGPPPGPRPQTSRSTDPRPVVVTLRSSEDVGRVLSAGKQLRERFKVKVDKDLTPNQRHERKSKRGAMDELSAKGFIPFWRNGTQLWYFDKRTGQRYSYDERPPRASSSR